MCVISDKIQSGRESDRCKVLICDSDVGDTQWISKKKTSIFPFKPQRSDHPNFFEMFSKREVGYDSQAFQEALSLAEIYSDESHPHRHHSFKLLQMGTLRRQQMVTLHQNLDAHKRRCEEQASNRTKKSPKTCNHGIPKKKTGKKAAVINNVSKEQQSNRGIKKSPAKCSDDISKKETKKKSVSIVNKRSCAGNKQPKKPATSNKNNVALTKSKRSSVARTQTSSKSNNKVPQATSEKQKKVEDSRRDLKKSEVTSASASGLAQKRPSSTALALPVPEAAVGQQTTLKICGKKQKHNDAGIDSEPVLIPSNASNYAQHILEAKSQVIQQPQPKRDSSGYLLCVHNRRSFNCQKCAFKRTFVNYKPQTSEDVLDSTL